MPTRVRVTVDELSSNRVAVEGGDAGEKLGEGTLGQLENRTFELKEGESLTISAADPVTEPAPDPTQDVWDPRNRPNAIQVAEIGPKLPKASGELIDVEENGRLVQRAVELDMGKATQGGGVESKGGETPGDPVGADAPQGGTGNAAATGPESGDPGAKAAAETAKTDAAARSDQKTAAASKTEAKPQAAKK
jgi:hypothetical protein